MAKKSVCVSAVLFLSGALLISSCFLSSCAAQDKQKTANLTLPSKVVILDKMTLANRYFMDKWPDTGKPIVTNKSRPSNLWTRAAYYEGLMALYKIDPQKKYYDYAVAWGESHQWNLWGGIATRNADNQCCGQTYIDLYMIDPKPERIKNIKACIDNVISSPQDAGLCAAGRAV
jgi:hypothetical protein